MSVISGKILVIDDERNVAAVIKGILEKASFQVTTLTDSSRAMDLIDSEEFDVILSDLYMPGTGGIEILGYCQKSHPEVPVVIITAYGTVESAVSALKAGALDFVTKPFDQEELLNAVRKAVETRKRREQEPQMMHSDNFSDAEGGVNGALSSIVGSSPEIQEVHRVIQKIARGRSTVLIQGESGTGKELVAYEIHRLSDRSKKPFIKINCAAIPASLIESELFGYERGAFTGAVTSKPGRFELANEGTLFLDEIGEMPIEIQVKLLRVLQEQEFERVGGINTIRVDVHLLTATHKDLEQEVVAGRFLRDLYYRLNVVPIRIPSLKERMGDLEALVKWFLSEFSERVGRELTAVEPQVYQAFQSYEWPGNIRQLENVIERMAVMGEGSTLKKVDLPPEFLKRLESLEENADDSAIEGRVAGSFKDLVKKRTQWVERDLIEKALEENVGNVTKTAEKLGLSRKGLQIKMKELSVKR